MTARIEWDGSFISNIITTTTTLVNGLFAVNASSATLVEFDNTGTSDKWTSAKAVLTGTLASNAAVGTTIDLYMFETEVDGVATHDELAPTSTLRKGAKFVGSFKIPSAVSGTPIYCKTNISLNMVKKAKFTLYNGSGVTLNSGALVGIEGAGFNDS